MNREAQRAAAKERAFAVIEGTWREIAKDYTVGWAGPISAVATYYPFVVPAIADIKARIPVALPELVYQNRIDPPTVTIVAVPYHESYSEPYQCRLAANIDLAEVKRIHIDDFSAAIWFLINIRELPRPQQGSAFEQKLAALTGPRLLNY